MAPSLGAPSRCALLLWMVCCADAQAARGGGFRIGADVDPNAVEAAIRKAVAHIYGLQRNGNWEKTPQRRDRGQTLVTGAQWGGLSSIATYALLASGESTQDDRIRKAMVFLRDADIIGIYALGLRCQIYPFVRKMDDDWKKAIKRDYETLAASLKSKGDGAGMYNYFVNDGADGRFDHSVSQYGVLGLWAIAQTDTVEVPSALWKRMDHAWREHQHRDGSWGYTSTGGERGGTASMTAAGVATLFITQDYLNRGIGGECTGNIPDSSIEKGLKWMGDNFSQVAGGRRSFYTLYGVERIGVASGRKFFGTVNWYEDGAAWLVANQQADGSWGDLPDTCFALLFLVRGRAPVVMNKLEYQIDRVGDKPIVANWNQRPRDVANFVHWFIGASDGRFLNWQVVNLQVSPDDLHDAPILFIAGNQSLNFTDAQIAKLREYVEQGGIILGNADCASRQFTESFIKLGAKLFPQYEFRELDANHPIYTAQFIRGNWKGPLPTVLALTNEARVLMLLIPEADPARAWQMGIYGGKEVLHELIANVFIYAVDKRNLRNKGETYIVKPDPKVQARSSVRIARLEYAGNWSPEPGGWRRLSALMHNQRQIDLRIETVRLGAGKLDRSFLLAHMTGTGKFRLTAGEQADLKQFIKDGGTVVIDSLGGNMEFANCAEAELLAMFPGVLPPLPVLRADHEVYRAGLTIKDVGYRTHTRRIIGAYRSPQLRGLEHNGRIAAFVSREDLSVGLVGQPVDGIHGYQPGVTKNQDGTPIHGASDIMANIISYAAAQKGASRTR